MKKTYKIFLIILLIFSIVGLIYYFNLSNRHKAIVKTRTLHFLKLIDSDWNKTNEDNKLGFESPSLLIDGIYKSMEGPKAMQYFNIEPNNDSLFWMTGFKVKAKHTKSDTPISNDFICHMNINYIDQEHHGRWNLLNRINSQYPRLISLSHGIESINFPNGYGFPFWGNETFFMVTQSLNHNIKDSVFQIKHDISINYSKSDNIKPLMPKTIYMMLPFDINNRDASYNESNANSCIPVETKNHVYTNEDGQYFSGHWKIFPGTKTFKSNVTTQLAIKDTVSLHHITPHLHPFAKEFVLRDITTNNIIYKCKVKNHTNRIGLTSTPSFSSKEGVLMYPEHEYQIELITNNTSNKTQDMMASMFLFFYDSEMDTKIKSYYSAN
ncbi:hypothetical protein E1J38_012110 [Seonamhaeicola sediminis]|uniref:Uncharacterized protein n=1 Tax=Seonamhaeicola sediminis TaxID=2528206 RepID=A0A562YCJ6_9FLAO|nr:hypothetical protein [Seonamhaeicola sediminis]TWO31815.1 hypothetical protein E1J38_012110 [Seonamhaeicola sediminis]